MDYEDDLEYVLVVHVILEEKRGVELEEPERSMANVSSTELSWAKEG